VIRIDAPVVEVTILEDRARVIRRGTIALPAGQTRVVIAGVAPVLVDKTLSASARGARVLDVRCKRELAAWRTGEGAGHTERAGLASELAARMTEATAELATAEGELAITEHEHADAARLRAVLLAELAADAAWGRRPAGAVDRLARLDARDRELTAQLATQRHALDRGRRDLAALRARLDDAVRSAGVDAAAIELDVVCETPGEVELTTEYLVPGAVWRPYHTARLAGDRVTITTDACVWQHTGEDWRDVTISCSTERPSLGASPPRLASDEIRVQRKSEVVMVEARDQDIETTGLGADRVVQAAAQVPGVDDGGVAQTLRAPHPATILSDGRPYRVTLGSHEAGAELALVAFPERSPCVFTRTRQANGPRPLLAGPVDLIRDSGHVGRTSILYVAAGERFELGWGPEADVRLHRDEQRKRDEAGMLGSWNVTRVRVAVRLSNLGERARRVEVTERVPVSEIDKVEIHVAAAEAWRLEDDDGTRADDVEVVTARAIDDDGLATWTVELPGRGRRAVALEYRVRAHTSVVGV